MAKDKFQKQSDRERLKKEKEILSSDGAKKVIRDLVEHGHYEDVYKIFGSLAYRRNVPKSHKRKEIERLKVEGKFDELQAKFGERIYKKVLKDIKFQEIRDKRGWLMAVWMTRFKRPVKITTLAASGATAIVTPLYAHFTTEAIEQNEIEYQSEIEEYNHNNEEYAKEIHSAELNDLETMMIVTEDMWKSIDGYGEPGIDPIGFYELGLQENNMGVCRHMASDVAKKLNAINPDYNARIIMVKSDDHDYNKADIDINVVDDEVNSQHAFLDKVVKKKAIEVGKNVATAVLGDHVVVLVDIIDNDGTGEEKVTMALCPTNRGVGIYHNGQITMFNDPQREEDGLVHYNTKEAVTWSIGRGMDETGEIVSDFTDSFRQLKHPFSYYQEKYGRFAQQKALDNARARLLEIRKERKLLEIVDRAIDGSDREMRVRSELTEQGKNIYEIQKALDRMKRDAAEREEEKKANQLLEDSPDSEGPEDDQFSL